VWWRAAVVLALLLVSRAALAQAPDPAVLAAKSNEQLSDLAASPRSDPLLRRSAATALVTRLAEEGRFDEADAAGRQFARVVDPAAVRRTSVLRRRARIQLGSLVALAAAVGAALLSIVAARPSLPGAAQAVRRMAPAMIFFLVYAGGVGGFMASSYESGSAAPFLLFAGAMLPYLALLRTWSAVGSPHLAARSLRAVAAVAGALALGFLSVALVNPKYLEGFGL